VSIVKAPWFKMSEESIKYRIDVFRRYGNGKDEKWMPVAEFCSETSARTWAKLELSSYLNDNKVRLVEVNEVDLGF